jgi:hypothetical protein
MFEMILPPCCKGLENSQCLCINPAKNRFVPRKAEEDIARFLLQNHDKPHTLYSLHYKKGYSTEAIIKVFGNLKEVEGVTEEIVPCFEGSKKYRKYYRLNLCGRTYLQVRIFKADEERGIS